MKKYLLPHSGTYYKANLHCHSTDSDGQNTPEEIKAAYMEKGYSIVAFTNHDIMIDKNYLTDDSFLALNGFETQAPGKGSDILESRIFHACFISLDKDNLKHPLYHSTDFNYWGKEKAALIQHEENEPDFERYGTAECINEMVKRGRERGFFVTYNHPMWSLENYSDYSQYKGFNAMEICNTGSYFAGYDDYCPQVYDDMLRGGERLYCIMADDSHTVKDAFGGWVMIKASSLEYGAVAKALSEGSFYSGMGPEIYDLWVEDGEVHITCSAAKKISINTGRRTARALWATDENGLTEAKFSVKPEDVYVRLTVQDFEGNVACTNAYFTDEILGEKA